MALYRSWHNDCQSCVEFKGMRTAHAQWRSVKLAEKESRASDGGLAVLRLIGVKQKLKCLGKSLAAVKFILKETYLVDPWQTVAERQW